MAFPTRRAVLGGGLAALATAGAAWPLARTAPMVQLAYGPEKPFSFAALQERAAAMARQIYVAPIKPAPDVVETIDYARHNKLQFKPDAALFADRPGAALYTFFHLGHFFPKKVTMNAVENGSAREILYAPAYFTMPADSPAQRLGKDSGFAGFRVAQNDNPATWAPHELAAFLGASYFRAVSTLEQYGLSARGVAVNTAVPEGPEEFPDFREYWLEAPAPGQALGAIYALLDGPSVTGAYKFMLSKQNGVVMDVEAHVYLRKSVQQLGFAPISSMYWFSETRKPIFEDWRPEVHDSDGLQLLTGAGERLWRPLNNPSRVVTSAFADENPRGFGLMQRDTNFDHYLDGVNYDRRPSLWIEPQGKWGAGAVQLVEIPTNAEIHDNIVAMWVPKEKAAAGTSYHLTYKMHWTAYDGTDTPLAVVTATRMGQGGRHGQDFPNKHRKFLIEFKGGALDAVPEGEKPEQVVSASRGTITLFGHSEALRDQPTHWLTQFDLDVTGPEPVELRCFLKWGDKVLTETWAYQYHPEG